MVGVWNIDGHSVWGHEALMSYQDKKRPYSSGGQDNRGKWKKSGHRDLQQGRKHSRGPADISSYKCTVRSRESLQSEVPSNTHWLCLRDLDIHRNFGAILNPRAPICSLILQSLHFTSSTVPQDLINFILSCNTLQEVQFNKNTWSSSHWDSIIDALLKTKANIKSLTIWGFQGDINQLIALKELPHLSSFIIDSVSLDLKQVEKLISTERLEKLELSYCQLSTGLIQNIASFMDTQSNLVQYLILNGVPFNTPRQIESKLTSTMARRALTASSPNSTPYTKDEEASATLLTLNLGHYLPTKSDSRNFHPDVLAAFPSSSTSAATDFDLQRFSSIVCRQPSLCEERSVSQYLQMKLMPFLLLCLSRLERNGRLVVLESNTIVDVQPESEADRLQFQEDVNTEMVNRMNAIFELSRCGLTVRRDRASDSDKGASVSCADSDTREPRIWIWKKVGTSLQKEYGRFLQSHELYAEIGLRSLSQQHKKELQQIFEQWFMLRANGGDADEYAHSECLKKHILHDSRDAWRWIDDVSRLALDIPFTPILTPRQRDSDDVSGRDPRDSFGRDPTRETQPSSPWSSSPSPSPSPSPSSSSQDRSHASKSIQVSIISYGQFQESLQKSRFDALVRAAERNGSKSPLDDVLIMLLRYGAVFANFRQFCTNEELFQELVDAGVNCEGFASPFNAQILLMNPPRGTSMDDWRPSFCSCYEDTDHPFGALGSFFYQAFQGLQVFLNPPTVEAVLDATVEFIEQQMEKYQCSFHLLIPPWQDLRAYQMANKSSNLSNIRNIDTSRYPSQNPYSGESHSSKKQFDLIFFKK